MTATRFDQDALEELRSGLDRLGQTIARERQRFAAHGSVGKDLDLDFNARQAEYDAVRRALSLDGTDSQKRRNEMRAALDALKLSFERWTADIERAFNQTSK